MQGVVVGAAAFLLVMLSPPSTVLSSTFGFLTCCFQSAPALQSNTAPQDTLKPGGGLGVVVPNWRYTWDARKDNTQWGHRWNSAPEVVCRLHLKHWSHLADLEQLNTLSCEAAGYR